MPSVILVFQWRIIILYLLKSKSRFLFVCLSVFAAIQQYGERKVGGRLVLHLSTGAASEPLLVLLPGQGQGGSYSRGDFVCVCRGGESWGGMTYEGGCGGWQAPGIIDATGVGKDFSHHSDRER